MSWRALNEVFVNANTRQTLIQVERPQEKIRRWGHVIFSNNNEWFGYHVLYSLTNQKKGSFCLLSETMYSKLIHG